MTIGVRDLGGLSLSVIQADQIDVRYFVRFDFSSGPGVKRFTDRAGGFVGNVDGSSQTWTEAAFQMGPVPQSRNDVVSVSWIRFDNIDYTWTNWAFSPGIRGVPVSVYVGWFSTSTGALLGAYLLFAGITDDADLGQQAQMSLIPFRPPWTRNVPSKRAGATCINNYKDADTCQYVGSEPPGETTCDKTRRACVARSNQLHFNGADLLPPPGSAVTWAGMRISVGGAASSGGGTVTMPNLVQPTRLPIILPGRDRPPTHDLGPGRPTIYPTTTIPPR